MTPDTPNRPLHAPPSGFVQRDGQLLVGGWPLARLAQRVGSTPFYAYDRAQIQQRVAQLRAQLPPEVGLHYSVKANPMPALVQAMASLVDGFDVASGGELSVALDTPMAPAAISFAGPGKSLAELRRAVAAGVLVHAESETELEQLAALGAELGLPPRVSLRVNPDFELKSSGMRMGGGAKPFGIDAEGVPALLQRLPALGLALHGLQIFSGSQCLDAQAITQAQSQACALAQRLMQQAPPVVRDSLRTLNIGGGFGIPYFPGDRPLDLTPIGAHLTQLLPALRQALPQVRPVLELGRYLVGEAGIYVTRVLQRKQSRGQVFLMVDGGLHHHLAASGNFGQVLRKNYPVTVIAATPDPADAADAAGAVETVTVSGPLCTPLDVLAVQMALPVAQAGDLVVVFQSGAYGLSASPTAFLGHAAPAEVLV